MPIIIKKPCSFMSQHNILPFFRVTLSYTLFYLLLIVILPLTHMLFHASQLSFDELVNIITNKRVLASFSLTFSIAFLAAIINITLGMIVSWTIVRYNFFGKTILELLIDLPLALPTAIAGLTLATLYAHDAFLGKYLAKIGIHVAFTKLGMLVALIFVGLPLAIRTLEPVIREIDKDIEAAAENLGANNWHIFTKIYFPSFLPSILSAFNLCFARALCEYGAVIFISSNIPNESEVTSLLIYSKIEQFDYNQATAISIMMLITALVVFILINLLSKRAIR